MQLTGVMSESDTFFYHIIEVFLNCELLPQVGVRDVREETACVKLVIIV